MAAAARRGAGSGATCRRYHQAEEAVEALSRRLPGLVRSARPLREIAPLHVAAYIRMHPGSAPPVKQHLAAIRALCELAGRPPSAGGEPGPRRCGGPRNWEFDAVRDVAIFVGEDWRRVETGLQNMTYPCHRGTPPSVTPERILECLDREGLRATDALSRRRWRYPPSRSGAFSARAGRARPRSFRRRSTSSTSTSAYRRPPRRPPTEFFDNHHRERG